MEFVSVETRRWIVLSGVHRLCIARYFYHYESSPESARHEIHGVTIKDYSIDYGLKAMFEKICEVVKDRKLGFQVYVERRTWSRTDGEGWYRDLFQPRVVLNAGGQEYLVENVGEGIEVLDWLRGSRISLQFTRPRVPLAKVV